MAEHTAQKVIAGQDQQDQSLDDVVGDLMYGDPYSQDDEQDPENTDGAESQSEDPNQVPPSDDDQPAEDSQGEGEAASEEKEAGADESATETEGAPEGEPTVEIDGERVPLSQIREWRQGTMRQDDYTRKSQERERLHREAQERLDARDKLAADLTADPTFQAFIASNPEALPILLSDPDNSRKLIGNEKEIRAFWNDYELIKDNPSLVQRLGRSPEGTQAGEQIDDVVQQERIRSNVLAVANALDEAVDGLAAEYEGVDPEAVKSFVMKLGRYPEDENPEPRAVVASFERLYGLFFQLVDGRLQVDQTLMRNEFERLKATSRPADDEAARAAEHNRQVDEQLQDEPNAPATPGGSGSAPMSEEGKQYESVNDVIGDLLYGGGE